jgi:hypothetical protein
LPLNLQFRKKRATYGVEVGVKNKKIGGKAMKNRKKEQRKMNGNLQKTFSPQRTPQRTYVIGPDGLLYQIRSIEDRYTLREVFKEYVNM